jgi:hypothetical protein
MNKFTARNLTDRVAFRLPKAIAEQWKTAAAARRQTLSDWLREQISDGDIQQNPTKCRPRRIRETVRNYQKVDPELVRELARIGNNLNQIARQINQAVARESKIEVASFLVALTAIQAELQTALHRR